MLRTLWQLGRVDPGFRAAGVLALATQPTGPRVQTGEAKLAFYEEVFATLESVPGVGRVGAIQHLPLDGGGWGADLDVDGQPLAAGATPPRAGWRVVGGDYFRALGIPLLAGRGFGPQDRLVSSPVMIVNRRLADQLWPGESPLGKRLKAGNATGDEWATVVGVVGDVRHNSLRAEPGPEIYRPLTQYPHGGMTLVVGSAGEPMGLARSVSQAIWAVDPDVPITAVRTLEQVVEASVARPRLVLMALAAFAALGLALGAVGIYGVISYTVAQRTREIGVRMALGADAGTVVRRVVAQGLGYAGVGTLIGAGAALILGRGLSGLLFGVSPHDPLTFAVLVPFIMLVAGLASLPAAWRAARLDPLTALRED
jgi:predicted permease